MSAGTPVHPVAVPPDGDAGAHADQHTPSPSATSAGEPPADACVSGSSTSITKPGPAHLRKRRFMDKLEDYVARLTSRSTFWHRVASLIWLPYAFRSGIKIKKVDGNTFSAVLPFRRFNRNWYNAMAGASLLANSEIAGGMYIYGYCGGDYTVVCKRLEYRFLRPCFGPAIYRVTPLNNLDECLRTGHEFNFDIEMDIVQQLPTRGLRKELRVGKCLATFHVTPKALHEARAERREASAAREGKDRAKS